MNWYLQWKISKMQSIETASTTSLQLPNSSNTLTSKSLIKDTKSNIDNENFNIEKIIDLIYEIKSDGDFYKLKDSVVRTNNSEYIYLFAQGIFDIFFEGQHLFNYNNNDGITISQKNIIYDETLNLLLVSSITLYICF